MKATAIANANIALIKYWGKRDEGLFLPQNSSISLTTDCLSVKTTVEFSPRNKKDILILNNRNYPLNSKEHKKYLKPFLNKIRKLAGTKRKIKIVSQSNLPKGAGLASSAAGFAALTAAVNEALGLGLNKREMSILARQGSGSACRSIYGGFVEWRKGKKDDGSDSFAFQIAPADYWPEIRMVICLTSIKEKKVSSREGMAQTVKTSPFYPCWLKTIDKDIKIAKRAIKNRDISLLGKISEENCLKMHALMITTKPGIIYWNEKTIALIHKIRELRERGLKCYFTIDAGPQVKILCEKKDLKELIKGIKRMSGIKNVIITRPGPGVEISKSHLF